MHLAACDPYDTRKGEEVTSFMPSRSLGRTTCASCHSSKIEVSVRREPCSEAGDEREINDEV